MSISCFVLFFKLFIVPLLSGVWLLATIRHSKGNLEPFYLFLLNLFMWLMLLSGFSPRVCAGWDFNSCFVFWEKKNRCIISGWFNYCFALYRNALSVPSISGDVPSSKTIWIMINQNYQKKEPVLNTSNVEVRRCVISHSAGNQGRKWQRRKENRAWNNHEKHLEIMAWRWHVKHYNVHFQLIIELLMAQ